jgi:hypothetical protein
MALTDRLTLPRELTAAGAGLAVLLAVNCSGNPSLPSKVQETLRHIATADYGDAYQSSASGPLFDREGKVVGSFAIYDQGEKRVGSEVHIYSVETQIRGKSRLYQAIIDLRRHRVVSVR